MSDNSTVLFEPPEVGWRTILLGTWRQMRKDNLSGLAAGAAYYALFSIFPSLSALVSIYGLFADPLSVQKQIDALSGIMPAEVVNLVSGWLHALIQGTPRKFGIGLIVSFVAAAWSGWSAAGTMMTAIRVCYQEDDERSVTYFGLQALGLCAAFALLGAIGLALVTVPPLLPTYIPWVDQWSGAIALFRWPILALLASAGIAILYRFARAQRPKARRISWGVLTATLLWLLGSVLFSFYVSQIGSYDRTYGSVGAIVVLLIWLYLSAYAVLIGAELNAELERSAKSK